MRTTKIDTSFSRPSSVAPNHSWPLGISCTTGSSRGPAPRHRAASLFGQWIERELQQERREDDRETPVLHEVVNEAKEQEQRLVLFERAKANPTVKQALEIFGVELAEVRTIAQQEASE